MQWVPLDDVDQARSLLPPGQSENPNDPSRTVNVEGWVQGELHAAPLSRNAVDALAESTRSL